MIHLDYITKVILHQKAILNLHLTSPNSSNINLKSNYLVSVGTITILMFCICAGDTNNRRDNNMGKR